MNLVASLDVCSLVLILFQCAVSPSLTSQSWMQQNLWLYEIVARCLHLLSGQHLKAVGANGRVLACTATFAAIFQTPSLPNACAGTPAALNSIIKDFEGLCICKIIVIFSPRADCQWKRGCNGLQAIILLSHDIGKSCQRKHRTTKTEALHWDRQAYM